MRPTLTECEPNVINPENIHGTYQEESTNDYTGVIGGENIVPHMFIRIGESIIFNMNLILIWIMMRK
jgi:hypothetical protein